MLTVPLEEGSDPFPLHACLQIWFTRVTNRVASPPLWPPQQPQCSYYWIRPQEWSQQNLNPNQEGQESTQPLRFTENTWSSPRWAVGKERRGSAHGGTGSALGPGGSRCTPLHEPSRPQALRSRQGLRAPRTLPAWRQEAGPGACALPAPPVPLPESVAANKEMASRSTLIKAKWCRLPITKMGRRLKTHWIITHVTDQSFYD